MLKRITSFMILMSFAAGIVYAAPAALPENEQKACYDASGKVATCVNTGQDGELQTRVKPASPRFMVLSSGTGTVVTDNRTGLMWAGVASTPTVGSCTGGLKQWQAAVNYVVCLNKGFYLGHNDWRLPNDKELYSLQNNDYRDEKCGTARCDNNAAWLNANGFGSNNVQDYYWSSTTEPGHPLTAWTVNLSGGSMSVGYGYNKKDKNHEPNYVWPVRSGR